MKKPTVEDLAAMVQAQAQIAAEQTAQIKLLREALERDTERKPVTRRRRRRTIEPHQDFEPRAVGTPASDLPKVVDKIREEPSNGAHKTDAKSDLASSRLNRFKAGASTSHSGSQPEQKSFQALRERKPEEVEAEFDAHVIIALRVAPRDTRDLARDLAVPVGRAEKALERIRLKHPGRIKNVGMEDLPRWTWSVGDKATPDELHEQILGLLEMRPMFLTELVVATGARTSRVDGFLSKLKRAEVLIDISGKARNRLYQLLRRVTPR